MASIRPKGNGFEVTVSNGYDINGKKISYSSTYIPEPGMSPKKIEKELNIFAVKFEEQIKRGQNIKGERMTLAQLAEKFLLDMKPPEIERTTYHDYNRRLEMRILPSIGHRKLFEINNRLIKDYSTMLREDGIRLDGKPGHLSEASITKDRALISSLLSYSVQEGYLTINPLIYSGKQKGRKKASKEYKVENFTLEQTKGFLWAIDNPIQIKRKEHDSVDKNGKVRHIKEYSQTWSLPLKWRFYFYLALFSGNRRGENVSLTWQDLIFETGEVNIDKSTVCVDGDVFLKDTKTHASRVAFVPPLVMETGKLLLAEQKRISLEIGDQWEGYRGKEFDKNFVFIQWNGQQMNLSSPRHEFKRLIRIYNTNVATDETDKLPETATLHDLRHTTAAILISNNMDPRSVANILGHSDPTTTLNIYSYFFKNKHQEAANIMGNLLLESPEEKSVVGK